jgi:hypothetical protein
MSRSRHESLLGARSRPSRLLNNAPIRHSSPAAAGEESLFDENPRKRGIPRRL